MQATAHNGSFFLLHARCNKANPLKRWLAIAVREYSELAVLNTFKHSLSHQLALARQWKAILLSPFASLFRSSESSLCNIAHRKAEERIFSVQRFH